MASDTLKLAIILLFCTAVFCAEISFKQSEAQNCQPPTGCLFSNPNIWTPQPPQPQDSVVVDVGPVLLIARDNVTISGLEISLATFAAEDVTVDIRAITLGTGATVSFYNSLLISEELKLKRSSARFVAEGSRLSFLNVEIDENEPISTMEIRNSSLDSTIVVSKGIIQLFELASFTASVANITTIEAEPDTVIEVDYFHIFEHGNISTTHWDFNDLVVMPNATVALTKVPQTTAFTENIIVHGLLSVDAEIEIDTLTIGDYGVVSLNDNSHSKIKNTLTVSAHGGLRIGSCYVSIGTFNETSWINGTIVLADKHTVNFTRAEISLIENEPGSSGDIFFWVESSIREPATLTENIYVDDFSSLYIFADFVTTGRIMVKGVLAVFETTLSASSIDLTPQEIWIGTMRIFKSTINVDKISSLVGSQIQVEGPSKINGNLESEGVIYWSPDASLEISGNLDCHCALNPFLQLNTKSEPVLIAKNINITKESMIEVAVDEDIVKTSNDVTCLFAKANEKIVSLPKTIGSQDSELKSKKFALKQQENELYIKVSPAPHNGHSHPFPGWAIFLIIASIVLTVAAGGYFLYRKKPHLFKRFSYATIEDNREL